MGEVTQADRLEKLRMILDKFVDNMRIPNKVIDNNYNTEMHLHLVQMATQGYINLELLNNKKPVETTKKK